MNNLTSEELRAAIGGTDPIQPLTMPAGWTPDASAGLPRWIQTTADYLKYLGIFAAM